MSEDKANVQPCIFISHRHEDKDIADTIRCCIETAAPQQVRFCQTSHSGSSLKYGKPIPRQILNLLAKSEVVLFLYTEPNDDWSYCVYECGVALNPNKEDTTTIVLSCEDEVPTPLAHLHRVDLRNRESVRGFVKQLLTEETFFLQSKKILTSLKNDDPRITAQADNLFDTLRNNEALTRSYKSVSKNRWPALPQIQFKVPIDFDDTVRGALIRGNNEEIYSSVKSQCMIWGSDLFGARIFGYQEFPKDYSFGDLVCRWQSRNQGRRPSWAEALMKQLAEAACWEPPTEPWELVKHASEARWYVPMLVRVEKLPWKLRFEFDVYFLPVDLSDARKIEAAQTFLGDARVRRPEQPLEDDPRGP